MYWLRELETSYLGLYLLTALVMFVILKGYNPSRYKSMVSFWARTSSNSELNKPFNKDKALSIIPFLFRAIIFGLIIQIVLTKDVSVSAFDGMALNWTGGFIVFWAIKTLVEGGLVSLVNKQEWLLKIFYIRSVFKEKFAFFYACLLLFLVYLKLSSTAAIMFGLSYMIGLCFIHLRFIKLYFRHNKIKQVYIILYLCTFEIAPVWLLIQTLKH